MTLGDIFSNLLGLGRNEEDLCKAITTIDISLCQAICLTCTRRALVYLYHVQLFIPVKPIL